MNISLLKQQYVKEKDTIYCSLLRLACINDNKTYNQTEITSAISTLNQISAYEGVHKRLIPLLLAKSKKLNIFEGLNKPTQHALLKGTQIGVVSQLAKQYQLNILIDELSEHQIPIILLKSTAFSNRLYSKEHPRLSNDIDILVQEENWVKAQNIIANVMNYKAKTLPDVFGDAYEISYIPKGSTGDSVDLHMALINPLLFNINENYLWQTSLKHPFYNNDKIRELSAECALLHQAIHAFGDMNFCKYNLVDTHEILTQLKPNIDEVISLAQQWKCTLPLYFLLNNHQNIIENKINDKFIKSIEPSTIKKQIAIRLLNSEFNQPSLSSKSKRYRFNQLMSLFVFVGSLKNVFRMQWVFLISYLKLDSKNCG